MMSLRNIALAALILLAAGSCMNTPTIPVPPPDRSLFELTWEPEVPGYIHIVARYAFPEWTMEADRVWALVMNTTTHRGIVEPVDNEGSLDVYFEAVAGDRITIQSRQDDRESWPIEFTVPAPP